METRQPSLLEGVDLLPRPGEVPIASVQSSILAWQQTEAPIMRKGDVRITSIAKGIIIPWEQTNKEDFQ